MKKGNRYIALMLTVFMAIQIVLANPVLAAEDISSEDYPLAENAINSIAEDEVPLEVASEERDFSLLTEGEEPLNETENGAEGASGDEFFEDPMEKSSNMSSTEEPAQEVSEPNQSEYPDYTERTTDLEDDFASSPVDEEESGHIDDGTDSAEMTYDTKEQQPEPSTGEENTYNHDENDSSSFESEEEDTAETGIENQSDIVTSEEGADPDAFWGAEDIIDEKSVSEEQNQDDVTEPEEPDAAEEEVGTQNGNNNALEKGELEEIVSENGADSAYSEDEFEPIEFGEEELEVYVGHEEYTLTYFHDNSSYYEVITSVESSDPSIFTASFQNVYVTVKGIKVGTAVLTIKGNYGTVINMDVNVKSFLKKTSIEINAENQKSVGFCYLENKVIPYSVTSSDNSIATATVKTEKYRDYAENTLIIKGLKPGNAIITVKNKSTNSVSTIDVKVVKPPFTLDTTTIDLNAADRYMLRAVGSNIKKATSSNTKVLTVEQKDDRKVLLRPVKPGKATVTVVNHFGNSQKVTVTVTSFLKIKKLTLVAGKTRVIYDDDMINAFDYDEWNKKMSSSNTDVLEAKYERYNDEEIYTYYKAFVFKPKYPGKATVTVKCGKTGASSTIEVTVKAPSFELNSSKLTIKNEGSLIITASGSDIGKVNSSDKNIIKTELSTKRKIKLIPVKPGKATVSVTSKYGVKRNVSVTVSKEYFKALLTSKTKPGTQSYGTTEVKGKTAPSATVSASILGKAYSVKANSKGEYAFKNIPILKVGTKIVLSFKLQGQSISKTITVNKGNSSVRATKYIYKDSTQVPVEVKNVHSGDKVVMSIDGKLYSRTFKGSYSRITVNIGIKKPDKYGFRMVVKLKNKFDQDLALQYNNVYYGTTVRIGDTKAKVKWITGWNNPEEIEYDSSEEWWWYDFNGDGSTDGCLVFDKNGKVTYWSRSKD